MIIYKYARDVGAHLKKIRLSNTLAGFVPTMGALHKGHISLLEQSKAICDITICSIFINPTQFNNPEDLKKYPVTLEQDIYLLESQGCDILFLPGVEDIYPEGLETDKQFDLGYLENTLEGKYRPGHFQGVYRVVKRLLEIVDPTHLFLGQKDYQQCMVINRLLELENFPTELFICPTLREESGLAMSSRNMRLKDDEKKHAAEIYNSLNSVKQKLQPGPVAHLKQEAEEYLRGKGFDPDYVEIADAGNLKTVIEWDGKSGLVILAAAFLGEVRLIDNLLVKK